MQVRPAYFARLKITLSKLPEGSHRELKGVELETFLKSIGL
jgi:hypothetical protein